MKVYNIVFFRLNLQPIQAPNQKSNPKHKQKNLPENSTVKISRLKKLKITSKMQRSTTGDRLLTFVDVS
jgi:hypothetical protein